MQTSKLLPIGFMALALASTGAMVATAQTAPDTPAAEGQTTQPQGSEGQAPEAQARQDQSPQGTPMDARDGKDGKRGKRDGARHDRKWHGHGSKRMGGSAMFQQVFEQIDADKNGAITQDEIDAFRTARVGAADTSGDGALSLEEFDTLYRELTRARMVRAFQSLDTDGDGVISPAELDARIGNIVERMDRDNDGALSMPKRGGRG